MNRANGWIRALGLMALLAFVQGAIAAKMTFNGPGNFSNAALWTNGTTGKTGTLPVAGDNLRINGSCVYDVTTNLAYGYLRVGRNSAGTLTWPAGSTSVLQAAYVYSSAKGSAIDMTNGGVLQINTTKATGKTPWATTNMTFTPGTGTVVWNVNYAQTLPAAIPAYNNLTISSTGTVATSLGAATTVTGNLLISSGALNAGAFALNVAGNFTNNSTFTAGTGTVTLNGTAAQTISATSPVNFNNLAITNVANPNLTLATNVAVAATLTGTVTLTSTCPTDYTLTSNGGKAVAHSCIPATVASFDCIETGLTYTPNPVAPARNPLYTKLAGTAFSFNVVALKADGTLETNYAKSVTVELVDTSVAKACTSYPALATPVSQTLALTAGKAATANMTVTKSYPSLACRVTDKTVTPNIVACSADKFSVRPVSLTLAATGLDADIAGKNTTAAPVVKAGASFTLTATASDDGYTGTPTFDNAQLAAHAVAVLKGTLAGVFNAAVASTPNTAAIPASGTFTYDEVGYFKLNDNGLLDATFTAIDSAAGDCTADFSTTLVGGKYGCKVGSALTAYFGRFIPDHFDTVVTDGIPCPVGMICTPASGFTYSGQAFGTKVIARNAAGNNTENYCGTFAKDVTLSALDAPTGAVANPGPGSLANTNVSAATFTTHQLATPTTPVILGGEATVSTLIYTFTAAQTAPALIRVRASDADMRMVGVTTAGVTEGTTEIRSGRVKIANAHGSELLALPMTAAVQYYDGANWVVSAKDSTTSFNTNLASAGGHVNQAIVKGPLAGVSVQNANANPVANGVKTIILAKPGVAGSADISLSFPSHLLAGSNGAGVNPSVAGRATFSIYSGNNNIVYLREAY